MGGEAAKARLRAATWDRLVAARVALPPGPHGHIPHVRGGAQAAEVLTWQVPWLTAATVLVGPDVAQVDVRRAVLRSGRTLLMAVPRLVGARPFVEVRPGAVPAGRLDDAAVTAGALGWGLPRAAHELPRVDLVVVGSVAVDTCGGRLGKGAGYADRALAWVRHRLAPGARVATTVHPLQVLDAGRVPMAPHDVPVDLVATARTCTYTRTPYPRAA